MSLLSLQTGAGLTCNHPRLGGIIWISWRIYEEHLSLLGGSQVSISTPYVCLTNLREVYPLGTSIESNRTVSCLFLLRRSQSNSSTIIFSGPLFSYFISTLARVWWADGCMYSSLTLWAYTVHLFSVFHVFCPVIIILPLPRVNFDCLDSTVTKECVVTTNWCWFDM